jgi:K+/H+ antiporter YhaU regulatory subunit KhtT
MELAVEEVAVGRKSALVDRSILGANLRQGTVIVAGIHRRDRTMEFNPEPDTATRAGGKRAVLGRPHSRERLEDEALA